MVTKLFLAQHFTFGSVEFIGLLDLMVRVLLCCLCILQLGVIRAQADIYGCSAKMFKDGTLGACFKEVRDAHGEWWWLIGSALCVSACHMYGLLKGYI
jgi:hypothetical protein